MRRTSEIADEIIRKGISTIDYSKLNEEERKKLFTEVGDKCIEEGRILEAIESHEIAGNIEKSIIIDDKHLDKRPGSGFYPGADEFREKDEKIEGLNEVGDKCFEKGDLLKAILAYGAGGSREGLDKVGDRCLDEGNFPTAIEAYRITGNTEGLDEVGDRCLKEKKYSTAIEAYRITENTERLDKVGKKCLKKKRYLTAFDAYRIAGNTEGLDEVGDRCLKEKKYSTAFDAYKAAGRYDLANSVEEQ